MREVYSLSWESRHIYLVLIMLCLGVTFSNHAVGCLKFRSIGQRSSNLASKPVTSLSQICSNLLCFARIRLCSYLLNIVHISALPSCLFVHTMLGSFEVLERKHWRKISWSNVYLHFSTIRISSFFGSLPIFSIFVHKRSLCQSCVIVLKFFWSTRTPTHTLFILNIRAKGNTS
jgi:hypothetical protein